MPAIGISILALLMAALVARASGWRVGVGIFAILAFEYFIAAQGVLKQWERLPPALMVMMAVLVILTLRLAFSGRLDHLPIGVIVLSQAFRLPLELLMHQAYADGLMPKQMSFSGCNFDIVTGATALVVGALALRGAAPKWLLIAWNLLGTLLLLTIVVIAVVSTPVFEYFGTAPDQLNTWIADPPYVWLPGVLVPSALLGHALLWRRLRG
ncbi:MAG: hypothetical protein FJW38_30110 [Acidobacteria bacterium]|nr:hypothetical protein [Acidobacteriota bacterium]